MEHLSGDRRLRATRGPRPDRSEELSRSGRKYGLQGPGRRFPRRAGARAALLVTERRRVASGTNGEERRSNSGESGILLVMAPHSRISIRQRNLISFVAAVTLLGACSSSGQGGSTGGSGGSTGAGGATGGSIGATGGSAGGTGGAPAGSGGTTPGGSGGGGAGPGTGGSSQTGGLGGGGTGAGGNKAGSGGAAGSSAGG